MSTVDVGEELDWVASSLDVLDDFWETRDDLRAVGVPVAAGFSNADTEGFLKRPVTDWRGFSGRAASVLAAGLLFSPSPACFSGLDVLDPADDGGIFELGVGILRPDARSASLPGAASRVCDDEARGVLVPTGAPWVGVPLMGASGVLKALEGLASIDT